jgi:hypothetical protein
MNENWSWIFEQLAEFLSAYVREQKRKDDVKLRDQVTAAVLGFHFLLFLLTHSLMYTHKRKKKREREKYVIFFLELRRVKVDDEQSSAK